MNPTLIREAFADAKASMQACNEAPIVHAETIRTTERYIALANNTVVVASCAAIGVPTMTVAEYRAAQRARK